MAVKVHTLKIAPKYFDAVFAGTKKAELRKNDRNYRVGDILLQRECRHGVYSGRECCAIITHVLPVSEVTGDSGDWVVLSIQAITPLALLAELVSGGGK